MGYLCRGIAAWKIPFLKNMLFLSYRHTYKSGFRITTETGLQTRPSEHVVSRRRVGNARDLPRPGAHRATANRRSQCSAQSQPHAGPDPAPCAAPAMRSTTGSARRRDPGPTRAANRTIRHAPAARTYRIIAFCASAPTVNVMVARVATGVGPMPTSRASC